MSTKGLRAALFLLLLPLLGFGLLVGLIPCPWERGAR